MVNQARYEPYEASEFFADGMSARPRIPGTVARGENAPGERPAVDQALVQRGQERFNIHCSPCHGLDGFGQGTVVLRGYPLPPSFHDERLRSANDQHFYAVIEKGFGKMPPYGTSVAPRDRWAIVAYIRALQLTQHAPLAAVPESERGRLEEAQPGAEGGDHAR